MRRNSRRVLRALTLSCALTAIGAASPVLAQQNQQDAQIFADATIAYDHGDKAMALHLWRLLADRGLVAAQTNAGRMLLAGDGAAADPATAKSYLVSAGEAGDAEAQRLLAEAFLSGKAGPADPQAGARWMAMAAESGDPEALFRFGVLTDRGIGMPADVAQARAIYKKAATAGHADGAFNFAVMTQAGEGGPQDVQLAEKWYRRAASAGHAGAAHNLAVLYDSGLAGRRDLDEAAKWYAQAAKGGVALAADRLSELTVDGPTIKKASLTATAPAVTEAPIAPDTAPTVQNAAASSPNIAAKTPSAWTIRLASFREQQAAERGRAKLAGDLADLLDEGGLSIAAADVASLGTVHRVVFGPLPSRAAATALCQEIKLRGADCLPGAPES